VLPLKAIGIEIARKTLFCLVFKSYMAKLTNPFRNLIDREIECVGSPRGVSFGNDDCRLLFEALVIVLNRGIEIVDC